MPKPDDSELLDVQGHTVRISNPSKPYFSRGVHLSKLDIVRYFLSVAPGALRPIVDRPIVLKRFVNGADAEPFYQKRAPSDLPDFLRTVTLSFPSGRTADEVVVDTTPGLAWVVNLGCIELHPHPVRTANLDHPDELRVDLDPQPGVDWADVRTVSMEIKSLLDELNLVAWPKTSGSRGMHINIRIEPRWTFTEVRRAALALARAVEKRCSLASSKWWKEERHGVFIDYNQNAKDRTTCSAYSVRPLPDARVSTPLHWDEVLTCDPADFTVLTVPERFARLGGQLGDPHAAMDQHAGSLDALLEMAARDETEGLGDAPWPPHFSKQSGEGKRVAPSRAKKSSAESPTESAEDGPKKFSEQFAEGFGAHRFRKQSQKKSAASTDAAPDADSASAAAPATTKRTRRAPSTETSTDASPAKTKRAGRIPKMPLITIAQSPDRAAADAGLERWKAAHPEAAALLAPDDILVDRMRGSSQIWYRIRINLRNVPEDLRPPQSTPDPDDDPTRAWRESHL